MEVIVENKTLVGRIAVLDLIRPDRGPLPAWAPGSHIQVTLPLSDGIKNRHFSLCGADGARYWRIAVQRQTDGRGGSAFLVDRVAQGDRLEVSAPDNHFHFAPAPQARITFLAGGIGITPILPMIRTAERQRMQWRLVYSVRDPACVLFREELQQFPAERMQLHVSGDKGRLDLAQLVAPLTAGDHVFACGPLRLLDDIELLHEHRPAGWQLSLERFQNFTPRHSQHFEVFEVVLARSGTTYRIPADASILETLLKAGVEVPSSCRGGVCGACEQDVLEGTPLHLDAVLSAEERRANESMMICVSRAKSKRIVLDM